MGEAYLLTPGGIAAPADLYLYDGAGVAAVTTIDAQAGGTVPPASWPPQPGAWLGVYTGGYTSDDGKAWLGVTVDLASDYFGPANRLTTGNAAAMAGETARIRRGTRPVITQSPAKSEAGGSTATTPSYLMSAALGGDATAIAWWDAYIAALDTLSKVDQKIAVLATVAHEFTVQVSNGWITGPDAVPATYGQFLSWFIGRCRTGAPLVKIIAPWFNAGHGSADEKAILAAMSTANPPDGMSADFYTHSGAAHPENEQLDTVWRGSGNFGWITGNADYIRLGSPPLFATEFGVSKFFNGGSSPRTDADIATYYTNIRATMNSNGIVGALMFDRDSGPLGKYEIDTGAYPLGTAAFAASVAALAP